MMNNKNISLYQANKPDSAIHADSLNQLKEDTMLTKHRLQQIEQVFACLPFSDQDKVEYQQQGRMMLKELSHLYCDDAMALAGFIYPAFHALAHGVRSHVIDQMKSMLTSDTVKLLEGIEKMSMFDTIFISRAKFSQQKGLLDNTRKMILSMADDLRIVFMKLVERWIHLKNITSVLEQKRDAQKAMDIYAPLANRLGIGYFKWQIEDRAFRYLQPKRYRAISAALNMRRKEREQYLERFSKYLSDLLHQSRVQDFQLMSRAKHIYSIYCKIEKKQVPMHEIYDALAVRVLTDKIETCYGILGIIHAKWEPIPTEFDDYIAKPKPNGYRSLHTAIVGPDHQHIEIQIRTQAMHESSELGVAAHWKYKENNSTPPQYEEKINWLRELINWQKELTEQQHLPIQWNQPLFEDRIYVFTPHGDLLDLPSQATPLDFAYYIHTEVGHRCRGAKVNGKIAALTDALKTGDQVEILTIKVGFPSRDWLNTEQGYLKTSLAKAKVRHYIRQQNRENNKSQGVWLWEKAYRKSKWSKNALQKIYSSFNLASVDDLLISLGNGEISVPSILHRLDSFENNDHQKANHSASSEAELVPSPFSVEKHVKISQTDNLLTQLARCCRPIPGDSIIGYITKNRGITIHQATCSNIQRSIKQRPERITDIDWHDNMPQQFLVTLVITTDPTQSVIRDIIHTVGRYDLAIVTLHTYSNKTDDVNRIHVNLNTRQLSVLATCMRALQALPNVMVVRRKV